MATANVTCTPVLKQDQSYRLNYTEKAVVLDRYIATPKYHKMSVDFHEMGSVEVDLHHPIYHNWVGQEKGNIYKAPACITESREIQDLTKMPKLPLAPERAGEVLDNLRNVPVVKRAFEHSKEAGEIMMGLVAQQYKYQRYCNRFLDCHPAEMNGFSSTPYDFSALTPAQFEDANFESYPFETPGRSGNYANRKRELSRFDLEYGVMVSNKESNVLPYEHDEPDSEWQNLIDKMAKFKLDESQYIDREIKALIGIQASYVNKLHGLCIVMENELSVFNFHDEMVKTTAENFLWETTERVFKEGNEMPLREVLLEAFPKRYQEWEVMEHQWELIQYRMNIGSEQDTHSELSLLHKDGTLMKEIFAYEDYMAPQLTEKNKKFVLNHFMSSLEKWQTIKLDCWNAACETEGLPELKVNFKPYCFQPASLKAQALKAVVRETGPITQAHAHAFKNFLPQRDIDKLVHLANKA